MKNFQNYAVLRKLFLTLSFLLIVCEAANAQVYIGSTFGFTSRKDAGGVSKKDFKFVPEIGYQLNEKVYVGTNLGYRRIGDTTNSGFTYACDKYISFGIAPYIRYNLYQNEKVRLFADGVVSVWHAKYKGLQNAGEQTGKNIDGNRWTAGIRPGIAYDATLHFSFIKESRIPSPIQISIIASVLRPNAPNTPILSVDQLQN